MLKRFLASVSVACVIGMGSQAHAIEAWSVDIQGNGSAAFGQSNPALLKTGVESQWGLGGTWNAFNVPAHNLAAALNPSLTLADREGNASTAKFQVFGNVAGFSNGGGDALFRDYLFAAAGNSSPSFTWEITGLTPGKSYDMINYGGVARDGAIGVDLDGNGSIDTTKITPVNAGNMIRSIVADPSGKIAGTMANGTGDAEGNWAGFHFHESRVTEKLWSVDIQGTGGTVMSGVEPTFALGNVWNAFNVQHHPSAVVNPTLNLVDSDGQASGVAFNINGTVSSFNNAGTLTSDYLFFGAGNVTNVHSIDWSLTGLEAGQTYELFVYGGAIGGRDFNMIVDLDGNGVLDETAVNVGVNGAAFLNIVAGANGSILGNAARPTGEANWAGFQLRQLAPAVPEPATMSLLALGAMGLIARRRNRNA